MVLNGIKYKKLARRILNWVGRKIGHYLFEFNQKPDSTIWVVGSARSGTTLLANLINYDHQYRFMFEPFHPRNLPQNSKFVQHKYIRPNNKEEYWLNLANRIFSGKFQNFYVDKYSKGFIFRGRLIKDIFANLFMKWVNINFPDIKIILILRHPFSVALSKLKLREWMWMNEPKEFLKQKQLVEDYLYRFEGIIADVKNEFEKQIIIWSIIHFIPLQQFTHKQILVSFFEEIVTNPKREFERITHFLYNRGIKDNELIKIRTILGIPTHTTCADSNVKDKANLLGSWKKELTNSQIKKGIEILEIFGLSDIYNDKIMPNSAGIKEFLE